MAEKVLRGPTRKSIDGQEEAVGALWDFARALGVPINGGPDGMVDRDRLNAVGPALERIMAGFGYHVAEIQ
jgi:hypothetical protein